LTEIKINGPIPAIYDFEYETVNKIDDNGFAYKKTIITGGTPAWHCYDLAHYQDKITLVGLASFLREDQHEVETDSDRMFQSAKWFIIKNELPKHPRIYFVRYWDKAHTEAAVNPNASHTSGVLMAMIVHDHGLDSRSYWILDEVRGQWKWDERERVIKETAIADNKRYGKVICAVEMEPAGGKESAERTQLNLSGISNVIIDRVRGSKEMRVADFAAAAKSGKVYILNEPFVSNFIARILNFPFDSESKDTGDATGGAFRTLNNMGVRRRKW
jgi:predicted phage terminase large subunit-like protein